MTASCLRETCMPSRKGLDSKECRLLAIVLTVGRPPLFAGLRCGPTVKHVLANTLFHFSTHQAEFPSCSHVEVLEHKTETMANTKDFHQPSQSGVFAAEGCRPFQSILNRSLTVATANVVRGLRTNTIKRNRTRLYNRSKKARLRKAYTYLNRQCASHS